MLFYICGSPIGSSISTSLHFALRSSRRISGEIPWWIWCLSSSSSASFCSVLQKKIISWYSWRHIHKATYGKFSPCTMLRRAPRCVSVFKWESHVTWRTIWIRIFWTINRLFSVWFLNHHLNTGSFDNWTQIHYLNTILVWYSDGYCISNKLSLFKWNN